MINLLRSAARETTYPGARKINLSYAKVAKYLAIGLEIPSTIVGSLIVGYLIDRQFGTAPWFTVGAAFLGFIGAVVRLLKYLKYFSEAQPK
jgi:F0F1-type ATP synthase assembly protein I